MEMTLSLDQTLTHSAWFLVVGIAVVGFLLAGFKLGQRVRAKEPPPPTAESQPHLPDGGAVYELREEREPVEIPEGRAAPARDAGLRELRFHHPQPPRGRQIRAGLGLPEPAVVPGAAAAPEGRASGVQAERERMSRH